MKLDESKCRDPKCYCRNEQESLPSMSDMQACIGTGEVESRSVQRREALQKGEPMPEFDQPEMPERIWAKDFPEAKQPTGKMGGWVEWTDTTQTEYLRADKVRELVDEFEKYIELLCNDLNETVSLAAHHGWKSTKFEAGKEARERIAKTQTALFPEGVEK
jgi:hypothetical protein